MLELMDKYDVERQKILKFDIEKQTVIVDTFYRDSDSESYCVVVHGCLFNNNGDMLIQQRASTKKLKPNMWDISVAGGVHSGETSLCAIKREFNEELGIDLELDSYRPILTINWENGFDDFYVVNMGDVVTTDRFVFEDGEVQAVKWVSLREILEMIEDGKFVKYHKSLILLLFEMRNKFGCFA